MIEIDQEALCEVIKARLARTTNERHRTMLERMLEHAHYEHQGDLEGLMGTLGPATDYHFWRMSGDAGPKELGGVRDYYAHLVESNAHVLEFDCKRMVVDDDCIVIEGELTMITPGAFLAENPMAASFAEAGKNYLFKMRNVIFWPFDENLYIIGEDSYTGGPVEVRELADDELPLAYREAIGMPA
ncbi:hypothetical protein [Gordonia neofelifaecis]|uniref:SnoaL-like domain-containing protein n=1 Tax=Gordonia neofelifaecis NRRL B-59395 TaxID=644548 RepID=F1YJD8_9ACTN|nr:hypothetical protein [Gordonia neofelifaecis]EGD55171.1 hypothetical protein SCNU_09874 [Gordonia neofelifaecis NRRL B-59395]